jgi:hypothetical protein
MKRLIVLFCIEGIVATVAAFPAESQTQSQVPVRTYQQQMRPDPYPTTSGQPSAAPSYPPSTIPSGAPPIYQPISPSGTPSLRKGS